MKMKKLNYIIAGSLLSALVLAGCGNDKPNQEVQKLMTEAQAEDKIQKLLSEIQVKEDAAKKEVANIKNKAEQDKLTKEIEKTFGTMKEALTSLEMKIKTPTPNPYEEQVEVQEIESVEGTNDGQAQSN